MIEWIVLGIFVIITIVLLSGKGGWLIAGYNTMSAEEKAQYDARKLSKSVGVLFLFIDIEILIGSLVMNSSYGIKNETFAGLIFAGIIAITVIIGIILLNRNTHSK
ncbi:DUF3784 domain-containing protein [Fusibacter bizertensis]